MEHMIVIMLTVSHFFFNRVDKSFITKEQPLANQGILLLHIEKSCNQILWKCALENMFPF